MSCHLSPLDHEALLLISGPDSLTFLQGQTTCDTREVTAQQAVPGAYCTAQGRVVCDFLLSQLGDEQFALRLRRDTLATSADTFAKYIIFSKAELNTGDSHYQLFGCWGESAAETLTSVFGEVAQTPHGCCSGEGYLVIALDPQQQQFECYIDTRQHAELADQLAALTTAAPEAAWQALDITAGRGRVEAATSGEFIPQMLNYDLTGTVNFTKGCYTGQEVVARMHYRGKPKRRMYRALLTGDQAPAAGTALYTPENAQAVGTVANSTAVDGQVSLLVVATEGGVAGGLHVAAADGSLLTLADLPYSLTAD